MLSVAEIIGAGAGLVTVIGGTYALAPPFAHIRAERRQRREDLRTMLGGRPARKDDAGNVIAQEIPSVAASLKAITDKVHEINERTEHLANGGLASIVQRVDAKQDRYHEENKAEIRKMSETQQETAARQAAMQAQLQEVQRLAGDAAVLAARAEDTQKRDAEKLNEQITELREAIWERLDEMDRGPGTPDMDGPVG